MLGARVRRRLRSRDVRGDRTVIDDSACQRKRKSESESESVRYLLVEPSSRSAHSRTSCGRLRLEDLECFAGAEERSDEVHVQDGGEELKRHFIDRVHFLEFTRILRMPVRKGKKEKRTSASWGKRGRTLNNKSSLPNRSIVCSKRRLTSASSVMSPSTTRHFSGSAQATFVSCSSGRRRAVSARHHPAAESAIAVCLPMPSRCDVVCVHSTPRITCQQSAPQLK